MIIDHNFRVSRSLLIACAIVALALAGAACGDDAMLPTGPTTAAPQAGIETAGASFGLVSDSVVAQPVSNARCPSVAPFDFPFVLVVRPNDQVGLVVTQLQMQFTDANGVQMPSVTLPAPVPTTQFGSALAASRGGLQFPLRMGIGCGVGRSGTIVVQVTTRDASGRSGSGSVTIGVS